MATIKELHVNGLKHAVDADAERSLLSVLRDDLDLTGSKYGCGEGQCGACTVLIDGLPARSCITVAARRASRSAPSRDWPRATSCTQCRRRSSTCGRPPVRLLHSGHDHVGLGFAEQATASRTGKTSSASWAATSAAAAPMPGS